MNKFIDGFIPPNEQLIEDPLSPANLVGAINQKTTQSPSKFGGSMITLTLSDRLPCSGNHPGYSQEMGCAPDEYFQCNRCLRIVPWCRGCGDDMFGSCDDCWVKAHPEEV